MQLVSDFSDHVLTKRELGTAMIHTVTIGYDRSILESKDIIQLARPSKLGI
jgi:hypothetical protein